jgi:zinc and cadmium transporter
MPVVPVLVALGAFVTTLAGGFAALRFRDYQHLILGLTAGLMLGVVAFDLVPEALSQQPGELFGVRLATFMPRVSAYLPGRPWSGTA